jgi:hypothetical protein
MDADVRALIDGAKDAVKRVISDLREKADPAEQLRGAEHRALLAEHRAWMVEERARIADLKRQAEDRLASIRDGFDGKDGAPGRDGVDGKDGADGPAGRHGDDGKDGADGLAGADGKDGTNGKDGRDGLDGKDGAEGPAGRDGIDGKDGAEGVAGRAGRDVDDIEVLQNGATVELAFTVGDTRSVFELALPEGAAGEAGKDGRDGIDGKDGAAGLDGKDGVVGPAGDNGKDAYVGEARGLFDPDANYRAMDVVSLNGSEWRAKRDEPGECPGDGWMLSAGRGKRGDRGERGPEGREGQPGRSIVAGYADGKAMQIVLTDDGGTEHKIDLYDLAVAIRDAV